MKKNFKRVNCVRKSTFAYYGLDKANNFLAAPMCECGCGSYANLVVETDNDLCGFIHDMLEEYDCNHCAIFAFKNDSIAFMGVKLDGDVKVYKCSIKGEKRNSLKAIQEEFEFHCYGILEQADGNSYRIIMD